MNTLPLYRQLANHYLDAIRSGTLKTGERFPSIRLMMEKHAVSLSTAVQVCRELEGQGVLEARPRSGNYIRQPEPLPHPLPPPPLAADAYVGIHQQVSSVLKASQRATIKVNFANPYCAPQLYPLKTLQDHMVRRCVRINSCWAPPRPAPHPRSPRPDQQSPPERRADRDHQRRHRGA